MFNDIILTLIINNNNLSQNKIVMNISNINLIIITNNCKIQ